MPFEGDAFEASIAMYVLHHAPKPETVLNEMKRVSSKRLILVEELYRHFPGKIQLAALDWSVNFQAGLKSEIHWNSYLTESRLLNLIGEGWKVTRVQSNRNGGFDEVLWVIDKV
jgi:ubiquinone/menaquinone biosynthesis C-methylase UbiE